MIRYLSLVVAIISIVAIFSCRQNASTSSNTSGGVVATKEPSTSPSQKEPPNVEKRTIENKTETHTKGNKETSKPEAKVTQRPLPMGVPNPLTTPQGIPSQESQKPQKENEGDFKPAPLPGKGAKPVKKKPIKVEKKPSPAPNTNTKIVTFAMRPPAAEHRYEIQLTMAERTPKESFENKAAMVESVRTYRNSSCKIRIEKLTISGDKGKVENFLQSLKRANWSATFDKQGVLKNIRTNGLSRSTGLMTLGVSEGGLGFLNILFPSREVTVGANWLYTLKMNDVLEGWFPTGARIFGLDNGMIQYIFDGLEQKNDKTYAKFSFVLDYNVEGRRKVGKEEKPMTIMVRSQGNASVDMKTGLPETMTVQSSVYFTGADADKTITILTKSKKIK